MENLRLLENLIDRETNKKEEKKKDTVFKETTDLRETVRRKFFDVSVMLVLRVINTNCNDLVIFLTLKLKEKQEYHFKANLIGFVKKENKQETLI